MGRTLISRHDSPLGQWTRALCFPDPPLAAHVEMFWFVAGRADFARDRRLPNGKTHLLYGMGVDTHCFEPAFGGKFMRDNHVLRGKNPNYSGETVYA